jgi:ribosomal protein S18 acetylase RimI-like enzyme
MIRVVQQRDGMPSATIRPARIEDADAIASLHAASWRAHYRGSLSDAYLDGPIEAERQAVWAQRLYHPREGQVVLLAEMDSALIGFVCLFLDHDRDFGTMIDNLHVAVGHKGCGIGRLLMNHAAQSMLHALPRRPAYLYVLELNHAARRFYDRIGGIAAERGRKTEPDGSDVAVLRYVWLTPAALMAGTSAA